MNATAYSAPASPTYSITSAPQAWRRRLWRLILDTPNLDWLLLTKRPENIAKMMPWNWIDPHGVTEKGDWGMGERCYAAATSGLGISAEDQANYDRRWPILAQHTRSRAVR